MGDDAEAAVRLVRRDEIFRGEQLKEKTRMHLRLLNLASSHHDGSPMPCDVEVDPAEAALVIAAMRKVFSLLERERRGSTDYEPGEAEYDFARQTHAASSR